MKQIDIDDELYHYIASRTQSIGESASDILRRLLRLPASPHPFVLVQENMGSDSKTRGLTAGAKKKSVQQLTPESIAHKIETVLDSAEFQQESKGVNRFLRVLTALYLANPERFSLATEQVQGSERIYFAKDEQAILATGSGAKAKQIPESPFWVITNNNTERKGIILCGLIEAMALPNSLSVRIKSLFV